MQVMPPLFLKKLAYASTFQVHVFNRELIDEINHLLAGHLNPDDKALQENSVHLAFWLKEC